MSSIRETVARALYASDWPDGGEEVSLEETSATNQKNYADNADAAVEAFLAAAEAEGWQLVPRKATRDMLNAGMTADRARLAEVYLAILAGAPKFKVGA